MDIIRTETQLFNYLKENRLPDLVMARNQFSKWDCYSPETKCRLELKCRSKHFDGMLIEKAKYDSLMEKANGNGDIPVYVNSTPSGVYYWLLNDIEEPKWLNYALPKTSHFSDRSKVEKVIGFLQVSDAVTVVEY